MNCKYSNIQNYNFLFFNVFFYINFDLAFILMAIMILSWNDVFYNFVRTYLDCGCKNTLLKCTHKHKISIIVSRILSNTEIIIINCAINNTKNVSSFKSIDQNLFVHFRSKFSKTVHIINALPIDLIIYLSL